jgi:hypothetical protein
MTYSEKLRDPRWQSVRVDILNRDNHTCQWCGSVDDVLHIHHLYYEKDKEPWEADYRYLITICEYCHEEHHIKLKDYISELVNCLGKFKYSAIDIHKLVVLLSEINKIQKEDNGEICLAIRRYIRNNHNFNRIKNEHIRFEEDHKCMSIEEIFKYEF